MSSVECPYHEEEDDRTRENHADQKLGRLGVLAWGSEITLVSCVPAEHVCVHDDSLVEKKVWRGPW